MKFLHVSDLHVHTHEKDNVGVKSVLDYITQAYPEHRLIITGDITDDGAVAQYKNAFQFLSPFQDRVFIVPEWGTLDQNNWFSYRHEITLPQYLGNGMILNPEDTILMMRKFCTGN